MNHETTFFMFTVFVSAVCFFSSTGRSHTHAEGGLQWRTFNTRVPWTHAMAATKRMLPTQDRLPVQPVALAPASVP